MAAEARGRAPQAQRWACERTQTQQVLTVIPAAFISQTSASTVPARADNRARKAIARTRQIKHAKIND